MDDHAFGPADPNIDDQVVYGACRPGYPDSGSESVLEWIDHVSERGVERVVCLLDDAQLGLYDHLLADYEGAFGPENVLHAPIEDYTTISRETFEDLVLPFLRESDERDAKTVVHCSAGSGRTGHVLVGWLVRGRGYDLETAVRTVRATGREPLEGGKTADDLREAFGIEDGDEADEDDGDGDGEILD